MFSRVEGRIYSVPLCGSLSTIHSPRWKGVEESFGVRVNGPITDAQYERFDVMSDTETAPVVHRPSPRGDDTSQTPGLLRMTGVDPSVTPATKIWFGTAVNAPGTRSLPHHHGEAETGGYVLRGHGRIYYGENYSKWVDMFAGDFVFVPPFMPHVEVNMLTDDETWWMTARTPGNIVVNLPDVDDSVLEGFRRA